LDFPRGLLRVPAPSRSRFGNELILRNSACPRAEVLANARLFWARKVRHGKPGRPAVPKEVRQLIRTMTRDNPLWGAARIYGELLKLGISILR